MRNSHFGFSAILDALLVLCLALMPGCLEPGLLLPDGADLHISGSGTVATITPTAAPMTSPTQSPTQMNGTTPGGSEVTATPTPSSITPTPPASTPVPTPASSSNLIVLSPLNPVVAALGQKVTLSWRIADLPANPAIDILYRRSTQSPDANLTFVTDVFTTETGSRDIETTILEVGQTYVFTLQLRSGLEVVATTEITPRVTIKSPGLTISKPNTDFLLLASDKITIEWAGTYLIAGASLETFLDIDTNATNGNEILLKTEVPQKGVTSGNVVVPAQDLWSNPKIDKTIYYRIGLRIVNGGRMYTMAYAPCMTRLYDGQDFNVVSPVQDMNVRFGDPYQIKWTTSGIPASLTVKLALIDRSTGVAVPMNQSYAASVGSATLQSANLTPYHSYDVTLSLMGGQMEYVKRTAPGVVKVTTEGATIAITNLQLLDSTGKVYIGLGGKFDFTWALTQPPAGAMVKLFLDGDGNVQTTIDQLEITPQGGVDALASKAEFSPAADFAGVGADYYVVAKLCKGEIIFAQNVAAGKVHIGHGGVDITNPNTDVEVKLGASVNIQWTFSPASILGRAKIVRLYANELPVYDPYNSIELTDPNTGLDATLDITTFAANTTLLAQDKKYYVIARFFLEGSLEEESQAVSKGRICLPKTTMSVLTPTEDITSDAQLQAIMVTWEIGGIELAGRTVRVLGIGSTPSDPNDPNSAPAEYVISDSDVGADKHAMVDATKLPPGTYSIQCRLLEKGKNGEEIIRMTANARGRVTVADGYFKVYDLTAMSAVQTRGYSPIAGCVFTGFNIQDQVGYDVAGVGDMNGDGYSDFTIWAKYGQEYSGGKAGEGYLIYGQATMQPVISLNSITSPDPNSRPVNGTIMMMPMENMWHMENGEEKGHFEITSTPDISGDGKADLIISCPDTRPLKVVYVNTDAKNDVTLVQDHYGRPKTLAKGSRSDPEIAHLQPLFLVEGPADDVATIHWHWNWYGSQFLAGDTVTVTVDPVVVGTETKHSVTFSSDFSGVTRGSVYYLTSQRMGLYMNKPFDMGVIGSPVETGGLSGIALDQMMTYYESGSGFGAACSVIPDFDGSNVPRVIISAPNYFTSDYQYGVAMVFNSNLRALLTDNNWATIATIPWVDAGSYIYNSSHHNSLPGSPKFSILGPDPTARLTGVSGLGRFVNGNDYSHYVGGDFNADGIPDMVMGTPGTNGGAGAIYLIYTRPMMAYRDGDMYLQFLNQQVPYEYESLVVPIIGMKINGTIPGQALGEVVKSAGDFNGDGLIDIMFVSPRATSSSNQVKTGRVTILFGKQNGYIGDYDVRDIGSLLGSQMPGLIFEGQLAEDEFGDKIAAINDVNGDGCDDILVGAAGADGPNGDNCGKVYLIYGRKDIIKKDPVSGLTFVDLNNDGEPDGKEDLNNDNQPDGVWTAQRIGQPGGVPGAVFVGEAAGDRLHTVDQAGDVNGDGLNDFILGAPGANVSDVQQGAGKAYLIFGKPYMLPASKKQ